MRKYWYIPVPQGSWDMLGYRACRLQVVVISGPQAHWDSMIDNRKIAPEKSRILCVHSTYVGDFASVTVRVV